MHKILVFGMTENPGGVESFLYNYISEMDPKDFQFDFLCNSYEKVAYAFWHSRARKNMELKEIANRMKVVEGNSVECMSKLLDPVDVIYLDPMFPARQKSSLINKKLQLIQKLEPPCSEETDLFDAAIKVNPDKIIVKRPLKSECLAGREPSYTLKGKAIRYDCYVL